MQIVVVSLKVAGGGLGLIIASCVHTHDTFFIYTFILMHLLFPSRIIAGELK